MSKLGTSRSSLTDGLDISPTGGAASKKAAASDTNMMKYVKVGVIVVCLGGAAYMTYSQFLASPSLPPLPSGSDATSPGGKAQPLPEPRRRVFNSKPSEKSN